MRQTGRAKKKLLFVTPTGDTKAGGEISNLELIKAARRKGYGVHVVVPAESGLGQSLKELGIPYSVISYGWWMDKAAEESGSLNLRAVRAIHDLVVSRRIDCVITNTLNLPWAALASALANKPHIWIAREFPIHEFSYLKDRYDYIKNFSNLVMANSKNLAEYMQNELAVPTKHFYSFVDTAGLSLSTSKDTRLVSVGHIYPRKNQLELVEAIARLKEKGGPVPRVLFIGQKFDKQYYEKIKRFINRHDIAEHIEFVAYNPRPFSLVGENDIYVQTSWAESIGRTTTEAMKLGLICVGADIPGVKEAFDLGGGILYKSGNPTDLAGKISSVLADVETYKKQAVQARKQALANMSEEACHTPFFQALDETIGKDNPRSELKHLSPYVSGAVKESEKLSKDLAAANVHIKNLDSQLRAMQESRLWKSSVRIRKLFERR